MRRRTVTAAAIVAAMVGGCAPIDYSATAWPGSIERDQAGRAIARFVPPELYAGAAWDGDRTLTLRPIEVTRYPVIPARHPPISFSGPFDWPSDPPLRVWRRNRVSGQSGEVDQYFAINERSDGLGRVFDQRSGRRRGDIAECFKFPLGLWRAGETRRCRESTIVVLDLDIVFAGTPHCLKFRWNDEGTYTYCPDRGMAAIEH